MISKKSIYNRVQCEKSKELVLLQTDNTQKRDNQPYTRGSHCQNLSLKRHFRSYLSLVKATYDRSQQPFAAMFTRHISSLIKLACTHSSGFVLIKISLPLNVLHFVFRFIGPRISQQYIITL